MRLPFSDGEPYTIVSNPDCHSRKGSLVAIINVVKWLYHWRTKTQDTFFKAFKSKGGYLGYVQQYSLDSPMLFSQGYPDNRLPYPTDDLWGCAGIVHRPSLGSNPAGGWCHERVTIQGKIYFPFVFSNGDSLRQLLARSRYLLFKPLENGFGNKRSWERFFSLSIQTCRKLIPCHIPWGWFSPRIPIRMRRDSLRQNATARSTDPGSKVSRLLFLLWQNTMMVSWTSP